ncbi:DUF1850 domain-containing protein [Thiofilum flexile]|uniref:DUF1850 domain-containing protein n=1 Tax=Thiofilum flexile TaxID=125627 RepID=UPI0003787064|nr:DUF1850 domain-containing protein [Thiofilum flexile]
MSICILLAAGTLQLGGHAFSLNWIHSVEKVEWQEQWRVESQGLVLDTARVKGSGAGMEPADDAVLKEGWWEWHPQVPPLPEIVLANSNATVSNWQLCTEDKTCRDLKDTSLEVIRIKPCVLN